MKNRYLRLGRTQRVTFRWNTTDCSGRGWLDQKPNNSVAQLMEENPGFVESAMKQLGTRGPLTASELRGAGKRSGPWWDYPSGKIAMEWHFALRKASVATRKNFVRYYDLTERGISKLHLDGPTPTIDESHREMMRLAVRAHGVGTVSDLANYYNIRHPMLKPALMNL